MPEGVEHWTTQGATPAWPQGTTGHFVEKRIDVLLGRYSSPVTTLVLEVTEAAWIPMVAPLAATPTIWTPARSSSARGARSSYTRHVQRFQ